LISEFPSEARGRGVDGYHQSGEGGEEDKGNRVMDRLMDINKGGKEEEGIKVKG